MGADTDTSLSWSKRWPKRPTIKYTFEAIPGFFIQTQATPNLAAEAILSSSGLLESKAGTSRDLEGLLPRFGLIDASPSRWHTFRSRIASLQASSSSSSSANHDRDHREEDSNESGGTLIGTSVYKVIFAGRHGQGWHNVVINKYGKEDWINHWAKMNTDGELTWGPDPELTPLGISQARAVNGMWRSEAEYGIPFPESLYSSPFSRTANTAKISFSDLVQDGRAFSVKPLFIEDARERIERHTSDKRGTKSRLMSLFPEFAVEEGLTEEDELWTTERESMEHVRERVVDVLSRIFESDPSTFVSITAHYDWIEQLLVATNHPAYNLATGGVIPIVIKATVVGVNVSEIK